MQYAQGRIGKVFVIRFDNNEDIINELKQFAVKKKIRMGNVFLLGALHNAKLVAGPKKQTMPPDPCWIPFENAWETLGVGTITSSGKHADVHLHASIGRGTRVLTGCIRHTANVFLFIEAVVYEIKGVHAERTMDKKLGLKKLVVK